MVLENPNDEYSSNLILAYELCSQLVNEGDQLICQKWLSRIKKINTEDETIKQYRNEFLKTLMKVIISSPLKTNNLNIIKPENAVFISKWSSDRRTYVSAKSIPGKGILVYMAVNNDIAVQWDNEQI